MTDIWAFLLQTLTASGVALLLLTVKALFRDKLPPRWQFGIWCILGIILLIPAGLGGRYVLFHWPLAVEALRSALTGEAAFTRVALPFPIPNLSMPKSVFDWLYAVYFIGVVFCLGKYLLSYLRLRRILRKGEEASPEIKAQIGKIALEQKVRIRKVITVPGLPSAFVCGFFDPVLALPDGDVDDKILLHELLHLKQRDTVWSIIICVLRSIHWCNPLLVYCAKQAGNDLEARCDQRVMELLEGEDRRDYGKILLSMANDRFAKTPGATCVNNGGKNIRHRIETIARFKLYPRGMELAALCTAIVLALPLFLGIKADAVYDLSHAISPVLAFASARATPCTTLAGALDAYGKAILDENGVYRAMCAPADMQAELAKTVTFRYENGRYPYWDTGLDSYPKGENGYHIYNLRPVEGGYEALFVIELNYRPDGLETEQGKQVIACQNIRAEQEDGRWVVIPLEDFRWQEHIRQNLSWGASELPSLIFSATAADFRVEVQVQTVHFVDNTVTDDSPTNLFFGTATSYDLTPKPHAEFDWIQYSAENVCIHLGTQEQRDSIDRLGLSIIPKTAEEDHPRLQVPHGDHTVTSSSDGENWTSCHMEDGWGPVANMNGSGSSGPGDLYGTDLFPFGFAADLYINGEKAAELDLTLEEGGPK